MLITSKQSNDNSSSLQHDNPYVETHKYLHCKSSQVGVQLACSSPFQWPWSSTVQVDQFNAQIQCLNSEWSRTSISDRWRNKFDFVCDWSMAMKIEQAQQWQWSVCVHGSPTLERIQRWPLWIVPTEWCVFGFCSGFNSFLGSRRCSFTDHSCPQLQLMKAAPSPVFCDSIWSMFNSLYVCVFIF